MDCEKIKIKTNHFLDFFDRMDELPDVLDGYQLTYADIDYMDQYPEKFLPFVIYLLTRDLSQAYFNEDGISPDALELELNDYVKRHSDLV